jgi:hypothetical protein
MREGIVLSKRDRGCPPLKQAETNFGYREMERSVPYTLRQRYYKALAYL